jgi:hypothetical protein
MDDGAEFQKGGQREGESNFCDYGEAFRHNQMYENITIVRSDPFTNCMAGQ